MGMFPEDAKIPASKLISLWIAEGLVENSESGRLVEEEAEGYLMDLISSNVVMLSKRSYNGLPSLEYLLLQDRNFHPQKEWCLGDITFHKLKLLKLVRLDISRWDASEESFPLLETLVIRECDKLEEIPLSFADIPTLKHIKLIACGNKSLEASAAKIKKEVEAVKGCDRIDVTIQNIQGGYKRRL